MSGDNSLVHSTSVRPPPTYLLQNGQRTTSPVDRGTDAREGGQEPACQLCDPFVTASAALGGLLRTMVNMDTTHPSIHLSTSERFHSSKTFSASLRCCCHTHCCQSAGSLCPSICAKIPRKPSHLWPPYPAAPHGLTAAPSTFHCLPANSQVGTPVGTLALHTTTTTTPTPAPFHHMPDHMTPTDHITCPQIIVDQIDSRSLRYPSCNDNVYLSDIDVNVH